MPPPPPPAPLPLNSQCTAEGLTEGCDKSFSNKVNTGLCARCALYQRLYLEPESADRDERARILGGYPQCSGCGTTLPALRQGSLCTTCDAKAARLLRENNPDNTHPPGQYHTTNQLQQHQTNFQAQINGHGRNFMPAPLPDPLPRNTAFDTEELSKRRSAAAAPRGTMFSITFTLAMNYSGVVTPVQSPGPATTIVKGDVILNESLLRPVKDFNEVFRKVSKIQIQMEDISTRLSKNRIPPGGDMFMYRSISDAFDLLKSSHPDVLTVPASSRKSSTTLPVINLFLEIDAGAVEKRCKSLIPVEYGGDKKADKKRKKKDDDNGSDEEQAAIISPLVSTFKQIGGLQSRIPSTLGGPRKVSSALQVPTMTTISLCLPAIISSDNSDALELDWTNVREVTGRIHDRPFAQGLTKKAYYFDNDSGTRWVLKHYYQVSLSDTPKTNSLKGIDLNNKTSITLEENSTELFAEASRLEQGSKLLADFYTRAEDLNSYATKDFQFQTCELAFERQVDSLQANLSPASGLTPESYSNQRDASKTIFDDEEDQRLAEETPDGPPTRQEWDDTPFRSWWLVEPELSATNIRKWSGTMSQQQALTMDEATMSCFAHFTHDYTNGVLVFVDLQSLRAKTSPTHVLFDPMMHTEDENSGLGDQGQNGLDTWKRGHECEALCVSLGLKPTRSRGKASVHKAKKQKVVAAASDSDF